MRRVTTTLFSALLAIHCSSLSEAPKESVANAPARATSFNFDRMLTGKRGRASRHAKIIIKRHRPREDDYVTFYKGKERILTYWAGKESLDYSTWLQLISQVEKQLAGRVQVARQSRTLRQTPTKEELMQLITKLRPRFLLAVSAEITPETSGTLPVAFSVIDPVYRSELASHEQQFVARPAARQIAGLTVLQKEGAALSGVTGLLAQSLLPVRRKAKPLRKLLRKANVGRVSAYSYASDVRLSFEPVKDQKPVHLSGLPRDNVAIASGRYRVVAARSGHKKLVSEVAVRAGQRMRIQLQYADDPEINPIALHSVPRGLLLYQERDFVGFTPRLWDDPLPQPLPLQLVERRSEEGKVDFYDIGKFDFRGKRDGVIIWQEQATGADALIADDSLWEIGGNMVAQVGKPKSGDGADVIGSAITIGGKGVFMAVSPELYSPYTKLEIAHGAMHGVLRVGLSSGTDAIYMEKRGNLLRWVKQTTGVESSPWYEYPKGDAPTFSILWHTDEESKLAIAVSGKKLIENKPGWQKPVRIFIWLDHGENEGTSQLQGVKWKHQEEKWLGIF